SRDVAAVDRPIGEVERPDLHRFDAHLEQLSSEFVRMRHEAAKIVKSLTVTRCFAVQAEIVRPDIRGFGNIVGSSAGVVDTNAIPDWSAQHCVERPARGLAMDIPQGHVHSGIGPHLGAGASEPDIGTHLSVQRLDPAGILTEQHWRNAVVIGGLKCRTAEPALAQADNVIIGVDAYPDQGSTGSKSDRLNLIDFQGSISSVLYRREYFG